ncbi:hypothetical protein [Bradyrhizobium sp. LTSP885]|uniref:hypothetical protein n=1 Tax=Bradyrhizobium sp. LTSP885 TaxID=1619232 RepID=UPI00069BACF5|nr:hypothetical protein [Bradyrhizobium sp. LTSP885]
MIMFDRGTSAPHACQPGSRLTFVLALLALIAASPSKTHAADDAAAPGRAVLYEEDRADPAGRTSSGSIVWHTDTNKLAGAPDDIFVVADVDIPNKLKMTLTLKHNTDTSLPASHVFELTLVPVPGLRGGGINSVPGMLTKLNEQARGAPLAGLSVKVTDNVFLVGLSNVDADRQRNLQALRERSWIDIPLVDKIQHRYILAIEKGGSGQIAFTKAFAAWGQN